MKRFENKVALVTGGGSGIGAAAARRLASEGAKVIVTGRRLEAIEKVAKEIGGHAIAGDTTDFEHLKSAVEYAEKNYGGLDVLVANAGVEIHGPVLHATDQAWIDAMNTNARGKMLACKAAIPSMQKRGGGAIVIISSLAATRGAAGGAPYVASKAALLGLNRSIAMEHGIDNIRCNTICPGWVKTEMTDRVLDQFSKMRNTTPEAIEDKITKYTPLKRAGSPSELAGAVAFFASPDASYVTGMYLEVDGGASIVDVGTLTFANPDFN